jgi:hypothetical protein
MVDGSQRETARKTRQSDQHELEIFNLMGENCLNMTVTDCFVPPIKVGVNGVNRQLFFQCFLIIGKVPDIPLRIWNWKTNRSSF